MSFDDAFHRANELRESGDLTTLKSLFASGDDAVKAGVLNGLTGEPGANPEMGPGIISLAVEGAGHRLPEVRTWACFVFQDQCAWGVDISPAVEPLLSLLDDPDAGVRRMAAFATGNLCKRRFDWSRHFTALCRLLHDEDMYVREAAAWALARLSRAKQDIGPAVSDLVQVLARPGDYSEPRKNAARALLHHARKSDENLKQVQGAVAIAPLDARIKEVKRFQRDLEAIEAA